MTKMILILQAGDGKRRHLTVHSDRFTIGTFDDNDLYLEDPELEPRHAIIKRMPTGFQIYDCNTRTGTSVNGKRIKYSVDLRAGDLISFGNSFRVKVLIGNEESAFEAPGALRTGILPIRPSLAKSGSVLFDRDFLKSKVLYIIGSCGLLVLIFLIFVVFKLQQKSAVDPQKAVNQQLNAEMKSNKPPSHLTEDVPENADQTSSKTRFSNAAPTGDDHGSPPVKEEKIRQLAENVMQRLGKENYPFDTSTIEDINQKVKFHKGSASLKSMLINDRESISALTKKARRENLEPTYVVLAILANSDDSDPGDFRKLEQNKLEMCKHLAITFGKDADSYLLAVAAQTQGKGTKKTHPLLEKMRKTIQNVDMERTVWYMYRQGSIDAAGYASVLNFLAWGIILQDPRQFDIDADPVTF